MSLVALPTAVEQLVNAIATGHEPEPIHFESIACWRLSCGDGRGAARWQRWSLQRPHAAELSTALEGLTLVLGRPDLAARISDRGGWGAVLLAVDQGDTERALDLQKAAIASSRPIDPKLLQRLASRWQQVGQAEPALELLKAIPMQAATPALCNAIAHLLEHQHRFADAALWWDHSLAIDRLQPAALMQRSRNALQLKDPKLAFHLAQALYELDPDHPVGLELRVEALECLGALASVRLALAPLVRQGRERYRQQARAVTGWWHPRRRRQHRWRQQLPDGFKQLPLQPISPPRPLPTSGLADCRRIGLLASRDGIELAGALSEAGDSGVLWHLASREPLLCERNLSLLIPSGWQLRRWPHWQPELHGPLDALVIADPGLSAPIEAPERVLRPCR
jgi:hypothetical protein